MAKIYVDGKEHEVDETENLLQAVLSLGYDLPYFCWHPELESVGACRQCAVTMYADEDDERGRLVMACMEPAKDGARISLKDESSTEFRDEIIEWLMINHPHDCAVCEEGGECHLQDMTMMSRHRNRRFGGQKRTHENQDLGPFVGHEMNRCIACYRCVRFYRDYADGDDLRVLGQSKNVYFGRDADGPFENEFSGNLVEICPTGVFTDKPLGSSYIRKWDLQNAPSICTNCSLGCNISPGTRRGDLKRIQNRYHGEINGYFLCDRGRFGGGYAARDDRPQYPLVRQESGALEPVEMDVIEQELTQALANANGVVGIGSPHGFLEDNFGLRQWVGADNFATGMTARDLAASKQAKGLLERFADRLTGMRQVEDCDAVLVLGEDVTQVAPRLALSLRQAAKNKHRELAAAAGIPKWHARGVRDIGQDSYSPIYLATPSFTKLEDVATGVTHGREESIAALGFAVANALDSSAPKPESVDAAILEQAELIAEALAGAKKPLIVVGTSLGSEAIIKAAENVMAALNDKHDDASLFVTFQEANSLGLAMLDGLTVEDALERIEAGQADTLVVMQNDLYNRAGKSRVDAALDKVKQLIVIEHSMTETAARAQYVLPAGSFIETDGTLINNEGRAQRSFRAFIPDEPLQEGWRWSAHLANWSGKSGLQWEGTADIIDDIVDSLPQFKGIELAAPSTSFRKSGMRFPRASHRFSGRTALYANESVHEPKPKRDADSPMSNSMEGYYGKDTPSSVRAYSWSPGWNSNQQSITRFQDEVAGHNKDGDPGIHLFQAVAGNGYNPAELPTSGEWQAVPQYRIFGSEPLSARAAAVQERMELQETALNMSAETAELLGKAAEDSLTLKVDGEEITLPVTINNSLPVKTIGVPVGLDGLQGVNLPVDIQP